MENILETIKYWANQKYLATCYEKVGLKYESYDYNEYQKAIDSAILPLLKLSQIFPFVEGGSIRLSVNEVETDGTASTGGYYPKGSFYRVAIHYSGRITEEMAIEYFKSKYATHQFFSGTYHFTQDMKLIKYQTHVDGMGKYPLLFEEIAEFQQSELV